MPNRVQDTTAVSDAAAASDELLAACQEAYLLILQIPHVHPLRTRNQYVYCLLCDVIAKTTGRSPQDVQEGYEEKVFANALGEL